MQVLNALVRARKGHCRVVALFLAVLSVLLLPAPLKISGQTPVPEAQVKAVFLFRFAEFVEWPPEAFADPHSPLIIGILGEDPFGRYLDDIARNQQVNNRPFAIQRYRRVAEIKTCHVLFISRSENVHLEQILGFLTSKRILLVGESEGFARRGGAIEFVPQGTKIGLRINSGVAQAASLIISSKLLRQAEIVATGKE